MGDMADPKQIAALRAPPLITLAAARCLDYLLYPALPVVIPDAVFYAATNASGKLVHRRILDWYRTHTGAVRVEPTEAFQSATALIATQGGRMPRDLGERAAIEIIRNYPLSDAEPIEPGSFGILTAFGPATYAGSACSPARADSGIASAEAR